MRVFNQSDADGGTPLHRAAETCAIDCAKILLEHNADIDAQNFSGQTAFHVCAEKQDIVFGKFLLKNRARKNCRAGCIKCRFFIKQIERHDRNQREYELQLQQNKLEEQKILEQEKQDQQLAEQLSNLDLMKEIQKCREETGGPFFNKKENKKLKEQQERERLAEEQRKQQIMQIRQQRRGNYGNSSIYEYPANIGGRDQISDLSQDQIRPQISRRNDALTASDSYDQMIKQQNPQKQELIKTQNIQNSKQKSPKQEQQQLQEKIKSQSNQIQIQNKEINEKMPPTYDDQTKVNVVSQNQRKKNKKKRQKQLGPLEEEKKMGKTDESLNYESEGDLQTFYR